MDAARPSSANLLAQIFSVKKKPAKNTDWVKLILEAESTNHAAEKNSSIFQKQVSECIP